MSKKWNDLEGRENYDFLMTLDNLIFSIFFMWLTYRYAEVFLSGKFLEYTASNLKILIVIRSICLLISSYNAAKILQTLVELSSFNTPGRDYDDYKFRDKISYYKFLVEWKELKKNILLKEERILLLIRIAVFSVLWIIFSIIMSLQEMALYGTQNIFQQIMCIQKIDYDINNDNILEYDYKLPIISTSEYGIHYITLDASDTEDGSEVELVLTDAQYELLESNDDSSFRIKYYGSSGFVISIDDRSNASGKNLRQG